MHMLANASTPFGTQPGLSALYDALERIWITCEGHTLLSDTPFLVYRDGCVCKSPRGVMTVAPFSTHAEYYELWDELLLIAQGLASHQYTTIEIIELEDRARGLGFNLAKFCETYAKTDAALERRRHHH
jgi:hypothetical protein